MWNNFLEITSKHFHFLETEFGFARTTTKPPFIYYETDKLLVSVFYDYNRNYELDLGIRRAKDKPGDRRTMDLGFLMLLKEGPDSRNYQSRRVSYPSTREVLDIEVKRLAETLREYGSHILRGDLSDFERIEQVEKQELARAYRKFRPKI